MRTCQTLVPRHLRAIFILLFISLFGLVSFGQSRCSVGLRTGLNLPTSKYAGANLSTGFGSEATVHFRLVDQWSVYGGWGFNHFVVDNKEYADVDINENGYCFGVEYRYPVKSDRIDLLLSAGGVYNHVEQEDGGGTVVVDSGHGLGWQLQGGVGFNIGRRFSIVPSVSYRSLSNKMELYDSRFSFDLNYVATSVAVRYKF